MLWKGQRQSDNIEDRRGMSRGGMAIGGGLGGIVVLIIALLLGADPRQLLEQSGGVDPTRHANFSPHQSAGRGTGQFSATVLATTEDVWTRSFVNREELSQADAGVYRSGSSACGNARRWTFLLSGDEKLYLDLSFFANCRRGFARGDFAAAYGIAHEVGHHVQNLLGTMDKVTRRAVELARLRRTNFQYGLNCRRIFWLAFGHYAQARAA
jgi:predicted metalloprotease